MARNQAIHKAFGVLLGQASGPANPYNQDFRCIQCHYPVTAATWQAGVQNRNHCPYCLWSRHLDLYKAGDRFSACKCAMRPIGLTHKKTRNKYRPLGELMLIHQCCDCGRISINRIAADDDAAAIVQVFERSWGLEVGLRENLARQEITLLGKADESAVRSQLFGRYEGELVWA